MAAAPIKVPLAPDISCVGGYIVRLTALDATTGATVAGVVVSSVSMQVDTSDEPVEPEAIDVTPPVLLHVPG